MTTAEDICKIVPTELLESRVTDYHLVEIANDLVEWNMIAPFLDLTESEQEEIREDYPNQYNLQKREALRKWRAKNRDKATYKVLIEIFCSQNRVKLAEIVAKELASNNTPRIFDVFKPYLVDCYHDLPHPCNRQWPYMHSTQLFSDHTKSTFIELTLHQTPLVEINSSPRERNFKPVELSNILSSKKGERLVLFFEGVAGSGKTTLSWYLCQEWAEQRLLQQFKLLIHVQLNHPQVQSARNLAGLIPYPDKDLCNQVASAITYEEGNGVCFLLDGLDDASDDLLTFLFSIIKDTRSTALVPKLSFIMTSRPNSHILSYLQRTINTKVVIEGFSTKKLDEFLEDTLGVTSTEKILLNEKFRINPQIEAICCLPINAVIMAFLVKLCLLTNADLQLPVTQTALYKPLISNFLVRHVQTHLSEQDIPHIEDFAVDLPPDINKSFKLVCEMAYAASLKNLKLFTLKMLDQAKLGLDNSLGFLQIHPKITMFGQERYYSFPHLSIQEFLAAIHLHLMKQSPQTTAIKEIFNVNPLSQVLTFYAGLDRLSNRTALAVLTEVLKEPLISVNIYKSLILNPSPSHDPRRKAICLFRCIYEGDDITVFDSQVHVTPTQVRGTVYGTIIQYNFDMDTLNLFPVDCLAFGYFIRMESLRVSYYSQIIVRLGRCSDLGMISFMKELRKGINMATPGCVRFHCCHDSPSKEMLLAMKVLLQGQSNIRAFGLMSFGVEFDTICFALKCLLEGLCANSSCDDVAIQMFYFSDFHVYYLLLLMQVVTLQLLIAEFNVQKTMPLLSEAIRISRLTALALFFSDIDDNALLQLGRAIRNNTNLTCLRIYNDSQYTVQGIIRFLRCLINAPSVLEELYLNETVLMGARSVMEYQTSLSQVNKFRFIQNRAELKCLPGQPLVSGRESRLGTNPGDQYDNIRLEQLSNAYPDIKRTTE